ncbi:MAG TPA: four helix bundle protein [Ferruginibacter sp.]|nr:four helix bundle protein [Ferruginibacter sp.]
MRNFKELKIWKLGFDIAVNSISLTADFPTTEKFGLVSQINRAAISIPSNIAEGSSRKSEKDYNRFIEISLGSSFEFETQLLIAQKLKMGHPDLLQATLNMVIEEEKMLSGFSRKLS